MKSRAGAPGEFAIVTPTFNEIRNIGPLLTRIAAVCDAHPGTRFQVLVVDDSSPDGTADEASRVARTLPAKNLSVDVVTRAKKDGLGKAYIHGFKHVLKNYPSVAYVLQMDADLSHDPAYISGFLHQARKGTDLVVASRYIPGGGTPDWAIQRKLLSRGGNLYTQLFLGRRITDYTGGYNLYSAQLLRRIDLDTIQAGGYGFLIELKYAALQHARSVAQIPIVFMDRKHGSSKIPKSTLLKNMLLVPRVRLRMSLTKRRTI